MKIHLTGMLILVVVLALLDGSAWSGTCRRLILPFQDGSSYVAHFKFSK